MALRPPLAALLAAALLTGAGLSGCAPGAGVAEEAQTAEAPLVAVALAAPASSAGAIRASGVVGFKREPELAFTAPGVVADVLVDEGDMVRAGQVLARLRRTGAGANVDEAALARVNAERDLERTQALYERGFVSEARLEDARLAVARARDSSVLTAPSDGVILRRRAEPSQTVAAGAPILAFGETGSGVVVRAPAASGAAARVRVGDSVSVDVRDLQGAALAGRVSRVAAKSDDMTGAFEIEVRLEQTQGLRSGMVAEIEIEAAASADAGQAAILVPTMALLDARADQGVVFVIDDQNIARRRAVRTAGVTDAGVLVIEGLSEGERVVASGAAYVRDGEPVRVSDPS